MDRKRKVSDNSGRTQHRHANEIYNEIRKVRGNTKSCPFYGGSTYSGYGKDAHDQLNPTLPNPNVCLLYTSPSPRDMRRSRMPSSA